MTGSGGQNNRGRLLPPSPYGRGIKGEGDGCDRLKRPRRPPLWKSILTCVVLALAASAYAIPARPNFLFIAIDDLNDWVRKQRPRTLIVWVLAARCSATPTLE